MKMDNNKISIVIPVYNVEKYLDECLEHVVHQSYRNIEVIIVNDGSTDDSIKIINKYAKQDDRIFVITKENGGLSSARNIGIEYATGEYIGFIDSDDYPEYDMYECLMGLIQKYNTKIAICSYYRDSMSDNIGDEEYLSKEEAFLEISKCEKFEAHAWSKLYKRSLFVGVRYPEGKLYEDVFTTYKLFQKVDYIAYTSRKLYFYRINDNSITSRLYKEKDIDLVYGGLDFLNFLKDNGYSNACKVQYNANTRNAIAILRKMVCSGKYNENQVKELRKVIIDGYHGYWVSNYKMLSKLFGGMVIIFPCFLRLISTFSKIRKGK